MAGTKKGRKKKVRSCHAYKMDCEGGGGPGAPLRTSLTSPTRWERRRGDTKTSTISKNTTTSQERGSDFRFKGEKSTAKGGEKGSKSKGAAQDMLKFSVPRGK